MKWRNGCWRNARNESVEYWRCQTGSIFCGGEYRPKWRLCTNCRTRRWKQRKGCANKHDVFRLKRYGRKGRRPNGGGALFISYNGALFQHRRSLEVSYARALYERTTGVSLRQDQKVVAWCGGGVPLFEQLIVVPHGSMNETRLGYWLNR